MNNARPLILTLLAALLLIPTGARAEPRTDEDSTSGVAPIVRRGEAHPALWPATHSVGLVDAKTEARVSELLTRLSLEEKVGQLIQADIGNIKPDDLRRYPLGSILAGGSSPPLGADDRSPVQAWIDTARAFRKVSLRRRCRPLSWRSTIR